MVGALLRFILKNGWGEEIIPTELLGRLSFGFNLKRNLPKQNTRGCTYFSVVFVIQIFMLVDQCYKFLDTTHLLQMLAGSKRNASQRLQEPPLGCADRRLVASFLHLVPRRWFSILARLSRHKKCLRIFLFMLASCRSA